MITRLICLLIGHRPGEVLAHTQQGNRHLQTRLCRLCGRSYTITYWPNRD